VQEISVGFPFEYEFEELTILDTPACMLLVGWRRKTRNFLSEADAIMFVSYIKNIENKWFKKFYDHIITDKKKEFLFLVLTHKGDVSNNELPNIFKTAKHIFEELEPEKIIAVDSIFKIIWNKLKSGKSFEELKGELKKQETSPC